MSLEKLKNAIDNLPFQSLSEIIQNVEGRYHQLKTTVGGPFHEVLITTCKQAAVALDWADKGSTVSTHCHRNEREWLFVLFGAIKVTLHKSGKRDVEILQTGQSLCIEPDLLHSCEILGNNTLFLAITIPAAEGMK